MIPGGAELQSASSRLAPAKNSNRDRVGAGLARPLRELAHQAVELLGFEEVLALLFGMTLNALAGILADQDFPGGAVPASWQTRRTR